MLWKNHLTVWVFLLPMITWAGLSIFISNPFAFIFYLMWLMANDMDWDWGNTLMVKTFSFKMKSKGQKPIIMSPLAPVSAMIYNVFGHSAVMHYPETWLLITFGFYLLWLPLIYCYFFFLGTLVHLFEDWITVWGLPVPPTIKYLMVNPMSFFYSITKKKPLKSIPMLWESKGFPPPDNNWAKMSFQDLIYENSFFFTPKIMSFKVWWPMEIVAVLMLTMLSFMMMDPLGNLWTNNKPIYNFFENTNNMTYESFNKTYDMLNVLKEEKINIENFKTLVDHK